MRLKNSAFMPVFSAVTWLPHKLTPRRLLSGHGFLRAYFPCMSCNRALMVTEYC